MHVYAKIAGAIMSQGRARVHLYRLSLLLITVVLAGCASEPVYRGHASSVAPSHYDDHNAVSSVLYAYYDQWRGVPYRYGGVDRSGIDCSAFVRQTMRELESLNLPRTTTAQAQAGARVSADNLSPGDLVFFKTGQKSQHVGIYVGNGRFMHASTSRGVTLSSLDNSYWRRTYWQSRRLTTRTN